MALQETVYLNRDNTIKLGFLADGGAVNTASFDRVVVTLTDSAGTVYTWDSVSEPLAVFDFTTETAQVADTTTGILVIKLQDAQTPPVVGDDYIMNVIVYDAANANGLNWESPFPVRVVND